MLKIEENKENFLLGKNMLKKCIKCVFSKKIDGDSYCCACIEYCTNYNNFIEKEKSEIKAVEENKEMVNHPKHYNTGKYEVIDVIEDWNLNFNLGNAVKYISRCEHKGNKKQDLEKSIWYLQRELDKLR